MTRRQIAGWLAGGPNGQSPAKDRPEVPDASIPEDSIPGAFAKAAAANPDHGAVRTPHGTVTYAELDAMARGVTQLLAGGSLPGGSLKDELLVDGQIVEESLAAEPATTRPVLVLADHGTDAIAAILGVVGAGHAALPLDPLDPPTALADAAGHFGGGAVVTDVANADVVSSWGGRGPVVVVGTPEAQATTGTAVPEVDPGAPVPPLPAAPPVDPASPATVSSTSGTTARPKAVVHSHRNVVANAARYRAAIGAQASDVFVVVGSMAAQATATPLFAALLGGATVATWDLRRLGAGGLPRFVHATGGTVVHLPPAAIAAMPDTPMPTARLVSLGGDRVTTSQLHRARALFPNATLLLRYSTSETNWIAGWALAPGDPVPDEPPGAGHPVPWLGVRVANPDGSEASAGTVGDIEVTGSRLALSYLGDPDRTAERFVGTGADRTFRTGDRGRWDPDGSLEVVGRSDDVRNVRGTLVELAMVQAALERLDGVDTAAVVTGPDDRIVAFVTGAFASGSGSDGQRLRAAVARLLPAAAVPTRVVVVDALPRTSRNKVDRRALVAMAADGPETGGEPPVGQVEQQLAGILAAAVGSNDIGRHDDVFDLGADSLATVEIIAAIADRFGTALPPSVLLEHPTPAGLARWLDTANSTGSPTRARRSVVRLTIGPGDRAPVVIFTGGGGGHIAGAAMLAHRIGSRTCYAHVPHGFEFRALPDRTITAMGRRSATAVAGLGHDRVVLLGHSSGGSLALETARQLAGTGTTVPLVVLLDTLAMTPEVLSKRRLLPWLRWSLANDRRQRVSQGRRQSMVADTRAVGGFTWRRLRQWWLAATAGVVVRHGNGQHDAFEALTRRMLRRQTERPYAGDVLLVRADDTRWGHLPADLRWSTVGLGEFTVVHAGGDHNHMLAEPQMSRIAVIVDEALASI